MKIEEVCKECGEVHHLPTYDNICHIVKKANQRRRWLKQEVTWLNAWSVK